MSSQTSFVSDSQTVVEVTNDPGASTIDSQSSESTAQSHHHHNENNAVTHEPAPPDATETTVDASTQDTESSSDTNEMVSSAQSQAVMAATGESSPIPASRTGLIRPTFTSTWTRPSDPVNTIQPGIAAASVFVLVGVVAIALVFVRRWRRNRTRRRARSVTRLLNWQYEKEPHAPAPASLMEKASRHGTLSDVEGGLFANNAGIGAHSDPILKPPIAAKIRPESVKGFGESPFPNASSSSGVVKFALPHAPAKPSPLRG